MPAAKIDRARLLELHSSGLPPLEIAERLGVTPPSVTRALILEGVRLRPPRGAYADTVAEIIANGGTFEQAARELGSPLKNVMRSWAVLCRNLGEQP